MLTKSDLIGAWELVSFETDKDGKASPWGPDLVGLLIYASEGYVSAAINKNSGLKNFDPVQDSLFYAGTFSLVGDEVSHHIRVATSASRIGSTLVRKGVLKGTLLELSGTSEQGRLFRLTWKKL